MMSGSGISAPARCGWGPVVRRIRELPRGLNSWTALLAQPLGSNDATPATVDSQIIINNLFPTDACANERNLIAFASMSSVLPGWPQSKLQALTSGSWNNTHVNVTNAASSQKMLPMLTAFATVGIHNG